MFFLLLNIVYFQNFEEIKKFDAPCVAVVGEPPVLVINIVGNKSYFKNLMLGLKSFIAFHFAFNIEYMKEARPIWYFVQYFVFGVNPENRRKGVNETLARDLGFSI